MNMEKAVRSEIRKWSSFDVDLYLVKENIKQCYHDISVGNYEDKKKSFIRLHYLKIKRKYILLKIYNNIKKNLYNEKLLNYFESILVANEFVVKLN